MMQPHSIAGMPGGTVDEPFTNEAMLLTVRMRAACQTGFAGSSKIPVARFDKEIKTSAVDIGNAAKPVETLRLIVATGMIQSTRSLPVCL